MKTDIIILAAGNSTRFESNKLFATLHGKPLLEHVLIACQKHHCIVVGKKEVQGLANRYQMQFVENQQSELGISHSIQLGIKHSNADRYLFVLGDQPFIQETTIDKMVSDPADQILCATYRHEWYSPVAFPMRYQEALLSLKGDRGGKSICHLHPDDVKEIEVGQLEVIDIDDQNTLQLFI